MPGAKKAAIRLDRGLSITGGFSLVLSTPGAVLSLTDLADSQTVILALFASMLDPELLCRQDGRQRAS
jgi:hypothetical protein